ncbi:TetR/AcrR family transcriptional regulator [Dactylosporangium sp. CA-233914]|uniref:TetR/AcrR family transcriptional regulator n=1 Tax=Dactylosporangium sp. CA-233914 TaxID=3239934 RepID=UPI003D916D48
MRADARRNHELLLTAARDVFVERGPDAPLDEIARRAGVSIATLYRRFVDRATLMHAVVLAALTATVEAVERVQRDHADPFDALSAYVHAVLDLRTSAVIPTLLDQLDLNEPQLNAARTKSAQLIEQLLDAAHHSGALRKGVAFGDIGLMLVRLSRPLPGPIPAETQHALAHRHADLFLAGLRTTPSDQRLCGPELDLAALHQLEQAANAPTRQPSTTP